MPHGVELSQVGIKLKDGTIFILEGPEIVNVELTLQAEQETLWTSDGSPFLPIVRQLAHMHLHLVSDKLVQTMGTEPEQLESGSLDTRLLEGE